MTSSWAFLLERPEIQIPGRLLDRVFSGRRVVITGAAGSVGTALSHLAFAHSPECLVLVDSHEASLVRLSREFESSDGKTPPRFVLGDVRDPRKMLQVLRRHRPDIVFHLAAYKQVPLGEANVDQVLDVNIVGTVNLVECAQETGVSTLVYPSTDKSVSPSSLYGASKRIVEQFLRATAQGPSSLEIRMVRLVNVFGTQGSVLELFARWIEAEQPIGITDPAMDRYWITMLEATHLLAAAAGRACFEGIYLLDVGEPVPILRTATALYRSMRPGLKGPDVRLLGLRPGERLHEYLHYPDERLRSTDVPGLLVLDLPDPEVDARDWFAEINQLRCRLFDVEPTLLRDWAFDVTTSRVPWKSRTDLTTVGSSHAR